MKKYKYVCPVCGTEYVLNAPACLVCKNCGFTSCDEWEVEIIEEVSE